MPGIVITVPFFYGDIPGMGGTDSRLPQRDPHIIECICILCRSNADAIYDGL